MKHMGASADASAVVLDELRRAIGPAGRCAWFAWSDGEDVQVVVGSQAGEVGDFAKRCGILDAIGGDV